MSPSPSRWATSANGELWIDLKGAASRFSAMVGIDDARKAGAEILLDRAVEESGKRSQATFEIVDTSGQIVAKVPFSG